MASVFISHEEEKNPRLVNTTGGDLSKDDFVVINELPLIANEDIADTEIGSFALFDGNIVHVDTATDGEAGEITFGTANADVFWNPSTSKFSDTSTISYIKIGTVYRVKDSDGVVKVRITSNTSTVA